MSLTLDDIKILSKHFPDDSIGVKVQSFSKDRTKAMLIQYLSHCDAYARIEEVDPAWSCSVIKTEHLGEVSLVHMSMTVKGVTRTNVGEGDDYKSAYSDAFKRCAMLFGVGRYLYDSEQVWVPYDEAKDKYRKWTIGDYRRVAPKAPEPKKQESKPETKEKPREDFQPPSDEIMKIGKYSGKKFSELLSSDHGYLHWVKDSIAGKPDSHAQMRALVRYAEFHGVYKL